VRLLIDCTLSISDICTTEKVEGYPTFKLYLKGKSLSEYTGGRSEEDLVKYVINAPFEKEEL